MQLVVVIEGELHSHCRMLNKPFTTEPCLPGFGNNVYMNASANINHAVEAVPAVSTQAYHLHNSRCVPDSSLYRAKQYNNHVFVRVWKYCTYACMLADSRAAEAVVAAVSSAAALYRNRLPAKQPALCAIWILRCIVPSSTAMFARV